MTAHEIEKVLCRQCYAVIDVEDKFCRHCGTPTAVSRSAPPQKLPAQSNTRPKLTDNRWVIVVMLFAVLGPVALPMLWRSSAFSMPWKIVLTVIVLGVTALAVWLLWHVTERALAPLKELRSFDGF